MAGGRRDHPKPALLSRGNPIPGALRLSEGSHPAPVWLKPGSGAAAGVGAAVPAGAGDEAALGAVAMEKAAQQHRASHARGWAPPARRPQGRAPPGHGGGGPAPLAQATPWPKGALGPAGPGNAEEGGGGGYRGPPCSPPEGTTPRSAPGWGVRSAPALPTCLTAGESSPRA